MAILGFNNIKSESFNSLRRGLSVLIRVTGPLHSLSESRARSVTHPMNEKLIIIPRPIIILIKFTTISKQCTSWHRFQYAT